MLDFLVRQELLVSTDLEVHRTRVRGSKLGSCGAALGVQRWLALLGVVGRRTWKSIIRGCEAASLVTIGRRDGMLFLGLS